MELGRALAKHLLIFINLICMVCATFLMIKGGMMLMIPEVKKTFPILILGLSFFVLFFSFLGFYGAIKDYKSLTLIYSIFMVVLLTLEGLLIFYTFYDQKKLVKFSEKVFEKAWEAQKDGDTVWINVIQEEFQCCGDKSVDDYKSRNIPDSCIKNKRPIEYAKEGCRNSIKTYILNNLNTFQNILFTISALQFIIFSLGCYLADNGGPGEKALMNLLDLNNRIRQMAQS